MYYGFYYDWTYILVLIGVVLSLLASSQVKGTFAKYSKIRSYSGMTGREAAEQILRRNGIYDVQVTHIAGNLTDHYDPRNKTLALSDPVYNSTSVAAIGVAAHECGHAIQHQKRIWTSGTSKHTGSGSQHRFQSFLADFCCRADLQHASASDARYSYVWTGCDLSACDTAG